MSTVVNGQLWTGMPASGEAATRLLSMVHREVIAAIVDASGGVHLIYGDAEIVVNADPAHQRPRTWLSR